MEKEKKNKKIDHVTKLVVVIRGEPRELIVIHTGVVLVVIAIVIVVVHVDIIIVTRETIEIVIDICPIADRAKRLRNSGFKGIGTDRPAKSREQRATKDRKGMRRKGNAEGKNS